MLDKQSIASLFLENSRFRDEIREFGGLPSISIFDKLIRFGNLFSVLLFIRVPLVKVT